MTEISMDSDLRSLAEGSVTPIPVSWDEVEVNVSTGVVGKKYISTLSDRILYLLDSTGGRLPSSITDLETVLSLYLENILASRVQYVLGKRTSVRPQTPLAIPAFWSVCLSNIGIAEMAEMGITIKPQPVVVDELSEQELSKVSNLLKIMDKQHGLTCSVGYSRDRSGSWDFMAMQVAQGLVARHDNVAHPAYAVAASFFEMQGLQEALLPRVNYGDLKHFRSLVEHLI